VTCQLREETYIACTCKYRVPVFSGLISHSGNLKTSQALERLTGDSLSLFGKGGKAAYVVPKANLLKTKRVCLGERKRQTPNIVV
jgi:hypothetical protein